MDYSIKVNLNDLSQFGIDIDAVPVITRNPDFTLIAEGYEFVITQESPTIPEIGDNVYFYSGSTLLHNGYVSDATYDNDSLDYNIEVEHALQKLKDIPIDKTNMEAKFTGSQETKTINGFDYDVIAHKELIESLFEAINFTVDFTYYTEPEYTWRCWSMTFTGEGQPAIFHSLLPYTFDESEVYYLIDQLYCINQNAIRTSTNIDADTTGGNENQLKKINAFDLLSVLISINKSVFVSATTSSFYIVNNSDTPVVGDRVYEYEEENFEKKADVAKLSYQSLPPYQVTDWWWSDDPQTWHDHWFPDSNSVHAKKQQWYISNSTSDSEYLKTMSDITSPFPVIPIGDSTTIQWFNHLNPIYLNWDGVDYFPYMAHVSAEWDKNPAVNLVTANINSGTKYILNAATRDIDLFTGTLKNVLRLEIDDIRKDTANLEYIIYD